MKNALAKLFFAVVLLMCFCNFANARSDCESLRKSSPLLLNLRLQMTPEETQNVFGKTLKLKIKKTGERIFFQNYIKKPAPIFLKNVRAFYLRFFEGKLYQIEVFYKSNSELKTLEFVTQTLAAQFGFSAQNWEIKNRYAKFECEEFLLKADNILNPHIELTDKTALQKVEEFRKLNKN